MGIDEQTISELIETFEAEIQSTAEPHQTLFHVINELARESDWQHLLAYFLDPGKGHGFDTEILSAFLHTVEERTEITNLDGPLNSIHFDVEVETSSNSRVDLLLSQEGAWFLCIELKVGASEHYHQTVDYVNASHIGGRAKSNYPTDGQYYLYISTDKTNQPSADEFVGLTWTPFEEAWQRLLNRRRTEDGGYPTRGIAQFAEFLEMIRSEIGDSQEEMQSYYRDLQTAKEAYESLIRPYSITLERGVRDRVSNPEKIRIRRRPSSTFHEFQEKKTRIEIDKPLWESGRGKPTILIELNFHIRPHAGPNTTKQRPSVGVYLDIRGNNQLMESLRSDFNKRVDINRYRSHGFGEPYAPNKWHFLHKEVLIGDTKTPIEDVLDSFEILWELEDELDVIAEHAQ
jgi:uncharacterized protein YgfB (UPF0149 family)